MKKNSTNTTTQNAVTAEDQVYERIWHAILQQRLPPGTKLTEDALCETFSTSRMRVRKVLQRLAQENIVTLITNRGAFVATPSVAEAEDVIRARRLIEPHILGLVIGLDAAARKQIAEALLEHVEQERKAREAGELSAVIRLSGEFHLRLAELAGSPILLKFMHELVLRNSLINAAFQAQSLSHCALTEHRELVQAILDGNTPLAVKLMTEHLQSKRDRLQLDRPRPAKPDVKALL